MTAPVVLQLLISGLSVGSLYALVALALVIPFKASGVLNFGQGETVTLGAYMALMLSAVVPWWAAFPLTLVAAAALGILIERLFIRPIVRAPEFTVVIATFALGLMIKEAIRIHWEDQVYTLPLPFGTEPWLLLGARLDPDFLWMIVTATVITLALVVFFRATRLGRAMRAVSQNEQAARLMGVGVERIYGATWAICTALGALVGILFAPVTGVEPEMGGIILKAFVAAVIGGFTSLPGAVVGGLSLGVIETFSGAFAGSTFKEVVAFVLLITFLLLRPEGLFAVPAARRV